MGLLRLFLALAVVGGHLSDHLGVPLIPGDSPVQVFFAISGFYMALILNEKYAVGSTSLFFTNRMLRIYPLYIAVLLLTLLAAWVGAALSLEPFPFRDSWTQLKPDWLSSIYLYISQALLLGQDLMYFLDLRNGSLHPSADFHTATGPFNRFSIVTQAWTLSIEIWFYMVAPLIARRSLSVIVALLVASLALRMGLQFGFGFKDDPWSYRFFPSEFALFLTGILGYHAYRERNTRGNAMRIFVIAAVCVGICLLINRWNGIGRVASITCLVAAIILIPTLFGRTNRNLIDRYLGELSYPIYVIHLLASWVIIEMTAGWPLAWQAAAVMIGTVVSAAVLYALISEPIERLRQRRAKALVIRAAHADTRQRP